VKFTPYHGPNGSGKFVPLASVLAGRRIEYEVTEGEVIFNGKKFGSKILQKFVQRRCGSSPFNIQRNPRR